MKTINHKTGNSFTVFLLQSSRLCKCSGSVVSCALFLTGMALVFTIGLMLALSAPSLARTAGETSVAATTTINPASGITANVTDTDAATGIRIGSRSVTSRSVDTATRVVNTTINASGSASRASPALYVSRTGGGDLTLRNNAHIDDGGDGIRATRSGVGALNIINNGGITDSYRGISARHEGNGDIDIDILSQGVISAGEDAVFVKNRGGSGNIDLSIKGEISSDYQGVFVDRVGVGNIGIRVYSSVTGSEKGIHTYHSQIGHGNTIVNVSQGASVTALSGKAIDIRQNSGEYDVHHNIMVTTREGSSVSGRRMGIVVAKNNSTNNGDIRITVGSRSSVSGGRFGIRTYHCGRGRNIVDVSGRVSNPGGWAVYMMGATRILVLRPGSSLEGEVVSDGVGQSNMYLRDVDGNSSLAGLLDLDVSEFLGFQLFSKSGESRWVVTGTASEYETFGRAYVAEGIMRFSSVNFRMASENSSQSFDTSVFVIDGDDASLEIAGNNTLRGSLRNKNGSLIFVRQEGVDGSLMNNTTYGSLTISGNYWGVGDSHSLDFNVDLAGQRASKLTIEGDFEDLNYGNTAFGKTSPGHVSMSVSVAPGVSGASSPLEGERTSPVLIEVKGKALATDFEGSTDVGIHNYVLDYENANNVHEWRFKYKGPAAHVAAAEATGEALTELAVGQSPSSGSSEERSDGLDFWNGVRGYTGGVWARQQNSRTSLDLGGITNGHLRTEDNRFRFGFNLPSMGLMSGDVVTGASMWQGISFSDASSPTGKGSVSVESYATALTASWWSPSGLYVDGQTQYVRFSSDVVSKGFSLVRDNEGNGMSASAEVGYRFAAPFGGMDLHIMPQMELVWSRAGFDDFFGPHGGLISLEDGDLVTRRLGLLYDGEWRDVGGSGHVYGGINLRTALDGRTAVNVSGVSFVRERKDISVDGRLGVSYEWDEGYAVHGEAVASRHDNMEEISLNLGVRIDF